MSSHFADTEEELNALLALITNSVKEVISTYKSVGHAVPSLRSVEPGPFDTPRSAPSHLAKSIKTIEGACAQLCATIATPGHMLANVTNCSYSLLETLIFMILALQRCLGR